MSVDSGVTGGNWDREARGLVLACFIAVSSVAELRVADGLWDEVKIVVDELAPLHDHVRQLVVRGDVVGAGQAGGHQPGTGKTESVVQDIRHPACK